MTIRKFKKLCKSPPPAPVFTGPAVRQQAANSQKVAKPKKPAIKVQRQIGGRRDPFSREQLMLVRAALKAKGLVRDMAILNLGIDSMLRGGDLLRLRVRDVTDHRGNILQAVRVKQNKTQRLVQLNLTPKTAEALIALIEVEKKRPDDFLFTATGQPHGPKLSTAMLRLLVKGWAKLCHADPALFSNHSLRRTKAAILYAETRDVESIRVLLGHMSLSQTIAYLGVTEADAGAIARNFDV